MEYDERPWGNYQVLDEGAAYKVKRIVVHPGKRLSLQSHSRRAEHWVIVSGSARATRDAEIIDLSPGETHVKKHVEEREQTVMLAVDLSASLRVGGGPRTKRDLAAEVCCVLGVTAASNGDRVGLLLFTDRVERYVPPARGTRHALGIA